MKEWIAFLTDNAVVAIDAMAVLLTPSPSRAPCRRGRT
jgi:hypothetical protein